MLTAQVELSLIMYLGQQILPSKGLIFDWSGFELGTGCQPELGIIIGRVIVTVW